jgi:hypothetical protein
VLTSGWLVEFPAADTRLIEPAASLMADTKTLLTCGWLVEFPAADTRLTVLSVQPPYWLTQNAAQLWLADWISIC